MKIAITGAAGRLGRAVVAHSVENGHEVIALDRVAFDPRQELYSDDRITYRVLDTTDAEAFSSAIGECDSLIHLAALISPRVAPPHVVHNLNVTSSYNALSAATDNGIRRVCLASSVNAIGCSFSMSPHSDYFPLDEKHPSYAEDAYSLSKWILEEQARSIVRRDPDMWVASLRFHALRSREEMTKRYLCDPPDGARNLWGYSPLRESAQACLAAASLDRAGAEVFYVVASDTASDRPSEELHQEFYPKVPVRVPFNGNSSFFDSTKARDALGWPA
jgi:nucleoside-diphosphate-sugar epimerase